MKDKEAFSPSSHILLFSELLVFLENHKASVELQMETSDTEVAEAILKDGSFYGLRGNQFELEVVSELNNSDYLDRYIANSCSGSFIFDMVFDYIVSDLNIDKNKIISVFSTNTVVKLKSGGNAKTDIVLYLETRANKYLATISVKNTNQKSVSCHDYKAADFKRVLDVQESKLGYYFDLYQEAGSNSEFLSKMSTQDSLQEFEELLSPYAQKFSEWALKGDHDFDNLIDPTSQVSQYVLIRNNDSIHFESFDSYIVKLFSGATCRVPDDQMSFRSYPLLVARELIQKVFPEHAYEHQAT